MAYIPRIADGELSARLKRSGAVLVEGAKGCGKTMLATQAAASIVHVDVDSAVPLLMGTEPGVILAGETPRLLDEWQWQPRLWDYVRHEVDSRGHRGQFILTGSATPDDEVRRHSGVGRFSILRLRTMSLWETGQSNGDVSLADIRAGGKVLSQAGALDLRGLGRTIVRGGWPATLSDDDDSAYGYVRDYVRLLAEADIGRMLSVRRDPVRVRRFIASLARNVASEVSLKTLVRDVAGADGAFERASASEYLAALERLMIMEDQPAWQTALKDTATLRKSPKRHLSDPSLAAAALGATPDRLIREPKTFGSLFESLVVRDIRTYVSGADGAVFHYRDSAQREIDLIIEYPDGWIACEVKLGSDAIDDAANRLRAITGNIDTQLVGEPDALVVITGISPSYRRPDGVVVVSISSLRP